MPADLAQKGTNEVTSVIGKHLADRIDWPRLTRQHESERRGESRVYDTIAAAIRFHTALWPTTMKMNDAITKAQ